MKIKSTIRRGGSIFDLRENRIAVERLVTTMLRIPKVSKATDFEVFGGRNRLSF